MAHIDITALRGPSRLAFLLLAGLFSVAISLTPAAASHPSPRVASHPIRVAGQVTAIAGPAANPTGFTLQLTDRSIAVRIVSRTTITARSAEALVDGFLANDFAVVTTVKSGGGWVANRIVYDAVPFGPIRQFTISGSVMRVSPNGKRFMLRLVTGARHWVQITRNSRFEVNGVPTTPAPILARTNPVEVKIRRANNYRWVALLINLKPAS